MPVPVPDRSSRGQAAVSSSDLPGPTSGSKHLLREAKQAVDRADGSGIFGKCANQDQSGGNEKVAAQHANKLPKTKTKKTTPWAQNKHTLKQKIKGSAAAAKQGLEDLERQEGGSAFFSDYADAPALGAAAAAKLKLKTPPCQMPVIPPPAGTGGRALGGGLRVAAVSMKAKAMKPFEEKTNKTKEKKSKPDDSGAYPQLHVRCVIVPAWRIDEVNILEATFDGMTTSVLQIQDGLGENNNRMSGVGASGTKISKVLIDGPHVPSLWTDKRRGKSKSAKGGKAGKGGSKVGKGTNESKEAFAATEAPSHQSANNNPGAQAQAGALSFSPPPFEVVPVIKGDGKEWLIAAASIVAKVVRDRYCVRFMEKRFPAYGFEKHKGYGVKAHMEALKKQGACAEHRFSFEPVKRVFEKSMATKKLLGKLGAGCGAGGNGANDSAAELQAGYEADKEGIAAGGGGAAEGSGSAGELVESKTGRGKSAATKKEGKGAAVGEQGGSKTKKRGRPAKRGSIADDESFPDGMQGGARKKQK
eukprot:g18275.t1